MELSRTTLGPFTLYTIETGRFRLDGGAMFGVVPKTLWSRLTEPDDKNRIYMAMRCLLIKSKNTGRLYLVDDGIGNKFNEKFEKIYAIDHEHSDLVSSLKYHGYEPDDITDVIFTHLHFDHCGGTTEFITGENEPEIIFKNANLWVTNRHWKTATEPNARETASFLPENIEPLKKSDNLQLIDGPFTYEEGLSTIIANGHTLGQQLPKIEADGKTLLFAADLLPTAVHVPLPWVMGYDMQPVETLTEKKDFLDRAIDESWYIFLEHDAYNEVITLARDGKKYKVGDNLTLNQV